MRSPSIGRVYDCSSSQLSSVSSDLDPAIGISFGDARCGRVGLKVQVASIEHDPQNSVNKLVGPSIRYRQHILGLQTSQQLTSVPPDA